VGHAAPQATAADPETLNGLPFAEARARILSLPADDARGLAIALLIQLNIMEKYAATPIQHDTAAIVAQMGGGGCGCLKAISA
jgi:hypothetical protein